MSAVAGSPLHLSNLSLIHRLEPTPCKACAPSYPRACTLAPCQGRVHGERGDRPDIMVWECDGCGAHGRVRRPSKAKLAVTAEEAGTAPLRVRVATDPASGEWE